MPSGASKRAPQPTQLQSADNAARHAGQAINSRTSITWLEDRVDERRERFHGRCENQDQAEEAQKHRKWHEPSKSGFIAPQAADEIGNRPARTGDHDQATVEAAALFEDHASVSLSVVAGAAGGFVTTVEPATSTSIPQRRNVRYPSSASVTIGSPATLNEVFSKTG